MSTNIKTFLLCRSGLFSSFLQQLAFVVHDFFDRNAFSKIVDRFFENFENLKIWKSIDLGFAL